MTRQEITSWVEGRLRALNGHDLGALASLYADDCVIESPTSGRPAQGAQAAVNIDRAWTTGFPDVAFTTSALLIEGDRFAWIGTTAGTDRGGFMGLAATDKRFAVPMVLVTTLRDGRIVRERRAYDFTGMLLQIGVLKARTSAPAGGAALPSAPDSAPAPVNVGEAHEADADVAELVRRHADAFARHDAAALAALHTEDAVMESHLAGRVEGTAAIADVYGRWFTALPDAHFQTEEVLVDGGRAAEMAVMTGTDRGGFFGFAPTGRAVRVGSAWLFTVRGGRFSYAHPIYDFTGMLVQMGLVRPKPV